MDNIIFLTLAEAIEIHSNQIENYGGTSEVRDFTLLESALAQPSATFSGDYLHEDIFSMAASYAYHICNNHPFCDGNKRTALVCALVFLELNGITIIDEEQKLLSAMLLVAQSKMSKKEFAEVLKSLQ